MPDHASIVHNPVTTPPPNAGLQFALVDDIIPPRYPNGADLMFMRPGEIGEVFRFYVPPGFMVVLIGPEQAQQLRPVIEKAKADQQRQVQRERDAMGHRG